MVFNVIGHVPTQLTHNGVCMCGTRVLRWEGGVQQTTSVFRKEEHPQEGATEEAWQDPPLQNSPWCDTTCSNNDKQDNTRLLYNICPLLLCLEEGLRCVSGSSCQQVLNAAFMIREPSHGVQPRKEGKGTSPVSVTGIRIVF
eukprot:TRINITY_DN103526_c0_g1_i1.p2 TRINITY_DN103526_c0_g1~~TRINITY_DN103526_c0_g1_i1.p2  ORF type:complete len:142 (-),score=14.99 TRINITY_DN103526_c0_g1_i1:345-770(-)